MNTSDNSTMKKRIIGIISGVIIAFSSIMGGFAFNGYNETLVKKADLNEKLNNYHTKSELSQYFPTKSELAEYYLTKKDVEKIYVTKLEAVIKAQKYDKMSEDIDEMRDILKAISIKIGVDLIVQSGDCPNPPCKKKKKKQAVAKSEEEEESDGPTD